METRSGKKRAKKESDEQLIKKAKELEEKRAKKESDEQLIKKAKELEEKYSKQYPKDTPQRSHQPTPFIVACELGNLDDVKVFLEGHKAAGGNKRELLDIIGHNIRNDYDDEMTPLMAAAERFRHEVVQYLIDEGANVNAFEPYIQRNALHKLCASIPDILYDQRKLADPLEWQCEQRVNAAITMTILLEYMSMESINKEAGTGDHGFRFHAHTPLDRLMGWPAGYDTWSGDRRWDYRLKKMKIFIDMLLRAGARTVSYSMVWYNNTTDGQTPVESTGVSVGDGKSSLRF